MPGLHTNGVSGSVARYGKLMTDRCNCKVMKTQQDALGIDRV